MNDHLGSSSVATDVMVCPVAAHTYFPYGEHRSSSGVFGTDRDFTGQRLDGGTGLHFYNARYYDSALGRFISPDSIVPDPGNPADYNRYSYVRNNPLRFADPSGHCPIQSSSSGYTDCWGEHNQILGFHRGPHTAIVNIGGDRYQKTMIPVIVVSNPLRPGGGRLFPTGAEEVVVPYAVVAQGECSGIQNCILRRSGPDSSTAPTHPHMVILDERHLANAGVVAHEIFHHVEQAAYGSRELWLAAYLWNGHRHGYVGNPFEARAREAQALVTEHQVAFSYRFDVQVTLRWRPPLPVRLPPPVY